MTLLSEAYLARMTPHDIAREHIAWCRRNGYSPARVLLDLGIPPGQSVPTWDDVRAVIIPISRADMEKLREKCD